MHKAQAHGVHQPGPLTHSTKDHHSCAPAVFNPQDCPDIFQQKLFDFPLGNADGLSGGKLSWMLSEVAEWLSKRVVDEPCRAVQSQLEVKN